MSYKYTVLSDYPIGFYQSNNVSTSVPLLTYQDILDEYGTYQDFENAFPNYQEVISKSIYDISGCENDAGFFGNVESSNLPLVYGESFAIKIDTDSYLTYNLLNGYDGQSGQIGFGTYDTSDHDFSLECWMYPNMTTTDVIPIIADNTENVGLFYDKGNIVFKLDTVRLDYTIPYTKKALHIVATYNNSKAYLYINGKLEASKSLTEFKFSNTSISLTSGPTIDSDDYLLMNGIAIYRYALGLERIKMHYDMAQSIPPSQVVTPEEGEIFEFYDNSLSTQYSYSFPANKPWEDFLTDDLYYDSVNNCLQILEGSGSSQSVELTHFITIPSGPTMDDSRIEWDGDNGVTVQSSIDGVTYVSCINGEAIPQYRLGGFDASRDLYIKITIATSDDSKYIPKLYTLSMSFYNNQIMYAQNSSSYFSKLENVSGVSVEDVNLSNKKYPILSKDYRNGLRTISDSGFYINTDLLVGTMEFFYTPYALTDSGLVSSLADTEYFASNYSWRNSGTISKTNIGAIYVNGVNKTSQTNISNVFKVGELHHVVMVFSDPISDAIKFNHSLYGAVPALFQNLALYPTEFDSTKALEHFNIYIGKTPTTITNTLATLTENSVTPYNNDWLVIQNV